MLQVQVYSVVRFTDSREPTASPSAEALGYSLSVRFADDVKNTFEANLFSVQVLLLTSLPCHYLTARFVT